MCIRINWIICMKPNRLFPNICTFTNAQWVAVCKYSHIFVTISLISFTKHRHTRTLWKLHPIPPDEVLTEFSLGKSTFKTFTISNRNRFENRQLTTEVDYSLWNLDESQQPSTTAVSSAIPNFNESEIAVANEFLCEQKMSKSIESIETLGIGSKLLIANWKFNRSILTAMCWDAIV